MTKPNPFLDQIKFFFSILSPRKHEDKRKNREKSGKNRESHGETMGRFCEIRRFSIRDRRTALCSRRRRSGCSPQLRLVLGTDRRTDGPMHRGEVTKLRSSRHFNWLSKFADILRTCSDLIWYDMIWFPQHFSCRQVYLLYLWWYFIWSWFEFTWNRVISVSRRPFVLLFSCLLPTYSTIDYHHSKSVYHTSLVQPSGSWFSSSCYRPRGVAYR